MIDTVDQLFQVILLTQDIAWMFLCRTHEPNYKIKYFQSNFSGKFFQEDAWWGSPQSSNNNGEPLQRTNCLKDGF